MLEAVHAFVDFKVDPPFVVKGMEVVFCDKLIWNYGKLNFDVFWAIKRGTQVEVSNVKAGKGGLGRGQSAVKEELNCFKGACSGSRVPGVCDAVTANGDAGAKGVRFLRAYFTDHPCVGDVFTAQGGNVVEVDGLEGVSAGHSWGTRDGRVVANTLAEAAQFVGVGGFPCLLMCGVLAQLAMLEHAS